jgi:uncharacterized membrane protein
MEDNEVKKKEGSTLENLIEKNIKTLVERRRKEEREKPIEERIADAVTAFTGNMAFVYTHIVIFGLWIIWNIGWISFKPFDPDFIGLSLITQIEAIFLTTFVLMTQRSLDTQADKRADLDLQISLLAEHEITRVITLVTAIAQKMDIKEALTEEISDLAKDIAPENILDTMENNTKLT